jgi:hypothetical protein
LIQRDVAESYWSGGVVRKSYGCVNRTLLRGDSYPTGNEPLRALHVWTGVEGKMGLDYTFWAFLWCVEAGRLMFFPFSACIPNTRIGS